MATLVDERAGAAWYAGGPGDEPLIDESALGLLLALAVLVVLLGRWVLGRPGAAG